MAVDRRLLRESQTMRRAGLRIAPATLAPKEAILIRKLRACSKEKQKMVFSKVDQTHERTTLYADLALDDSAESEDLRERK